MKTHLLLTLLFASSILFAQRAGDLDASFNGGKVTVDRAPLESIASMVLQPDGKILATGIAGDDRSLGGESNKLILMRFNPNGSLDAGFGTGGIVHTGFTFISFGVHSFALQHDGKIVLAGSEMNDKEEYEHRDMYIVRYNSNGAIDNTFNKVMVSDSASLHEVFVVIQSDGNIAVVGTQKKMVEDEMRSSIFMVQCDAEGHIENRNAVSMEEVDVKSIAKQPDDKVVVLCAGYYNATFALLRLNSDGSIDNSFGTDGVIRTLRNADEEGMVASAMALQADGKIVITGTIGLFNFYRQKGSKIALMRFNGDGSLDGSFGENGSQSNVIDSTCMAQAVLIQPDDKILVAGAAGSSRDMFDFALVRYNDDGSLDNTFGYGGVVTTNFKEMNVAFAMVQQQDGKIILAGGSGNNDKADLTLARYLSSSEAKPTDAPVANGLSITGNPVKGEQVLQYTLEQDGNVTIELYDVSGRLVMTLASNEPRSAGAHNETVRFDESLPSGRYLLTMTTTKESKSVWVVKQ